MRIVTVHARPPIPVKGFEWCAYDDALYDPEANDIIGWGSTKEEAIADLLRQIEEANNDGA